MKSGINHPLAWLFLLFCALNDLHAQEASHGRNYDEDEVHAYELPDVLQCKDGSLVGDASEWFTKRRPEILLDFQREMYGYTPNLPFRLQSQEIARAVEAVDGKATRSIVRLQFWDDESAPVIHLMIYLPNKTDKPVPLFLGMNFFGNASLESDVEIPLPTNWMRTKAKAVQDHRATEELRGIYGDRWPLGLILSRGYGLATFYYGDVEPDHIEGWRDGVRGFGLKLSGQERRAPNDWGAIGAWAWGLSRALDYLETHPEVDASRVAVFGHSRLGKAALWAGAQDDRFAMVISNNSGEGGASLARRNFGENIAFSIFHASWRYCGHFAQYVDKESDLPFDQHMLLATIAPRPLYIASASRDLLADPKGEFLSAKLAEPVYELLGEKGLGVGEWPRPDFPVGESVGYHLRSGEHDITQYDWLQYLGFADRHLRQASQ